MLVLLVIKRGQMLTDTLNTASELRLFKVKNLGALELESTQAQRPVCYSTLTQELNIIMMIISRGIIR